MKKTIVRQAKKLVESALFNGRRLLVDRCMDPSRDSTLLSWATYSPWLLDRDFLACREAIAGNTLVDVYRCWELWHLLGQTAALEGDVIEVGAWRGGTAGLLARRATDLGLDLRIYICDTFTGVIKPGEHDRSYGGGEHADTSVKIVEDLMARLGVTNTVILRGAFPDDTADAVADRRFRFCHIDVDVYRSGRDVLEWVWPRLATAGLVVFDDFGFPSTTGIATLVHEWEGRDDLVCVQNLNGHAVFVKTR